MAHSKKWGAWTKWGETWVIRMGFGSEVGWGRLRHIACSMLEAGRSWGCGGVRPRKALPLAAHRAWMSDVCGCVCVGHG